MTEWIADIMHSVLVGERLGRSTMGREKRCVCTQPKYTGEMRRKREGRGESTCRGQNIGDAPKNNFYFVLAFMGLSALEIASSYKAY